MASPRLDLRVPFVDLSSSFEEIADGVLTDLSEILASAAFINGPAVREFEEAFAHYCGVEHCIGLSSGLDAVRLALQALDVGPGDEVLVPAMTFVATWEAVTQVGAVPVPVEITSSDYCIDPKAAAAAVSSRTRAIVPVHLYGQLAEPEPVRALAVQHGLVVVEDACQAHGAARDGYPAGTVGRAAAFSFYPSKNLGAMGDAGAVVTDDAELAERVRTLREHGQRSKYIHDEVGWTARLDTIQAQVLLRKLPKLEGWNDQRQAVAAYYSRELAGVGDLTLPKEVTGSRHAWYVYVVRTSDASGLADFLGARGIGTARHYPQPPHLTLAYEDLGYSRGAFPIAEALGDECLSLPIYPGISSEQLDHVATNVKAWFDGDRAG